jgi:hypothetical protein
MDTVGRGLVDIWFIPDIKAQDFSQFPTYVSISCCFLGANEGKKVHKALSQPKDIVGWLDSGIIGKLNE